MLTFSPSLTSEDSTTQLSILPGRQRRISNADVIQVKQEVTSFKMFPRVEVKDEKKKLGECKAEFKPEIMRQLRFSCYCTMQGKRVSFFSYLPTFGQSLDTKDGVKKLQTIAVVTEFPKKYDNIQLV